MIEQFFDKTRRYGEPERTRYAREISELQKTLASQLDQEGKACLEQLEDAYIRQSSAELRDAFAERFCAAIELVQEARDRLFLRFRDSF